MFNIQKYCWAKCSICGHGKMYVDIFNWFFDKELAIHTMSAVMPIMVYYVLCCLRGHKPCGILVTAFSNLICELCAKKVIFQQWCLGERLHSSTLWLGMRFIFYRTSPFGDPKNVLFMEVVACCW